MLYCVIPVIVYVFPLLVCPYANILAEKNMYLFYMLDHNIRRKHEHVRERGVLYLQLIPLTTERATSLALSSYTCLVLISHPNTLSFIPAKIKEIGIEEVRNLRKPYHFQRFLLQNHALIHYFGLKLKGKNKVGISRGFRGKNKDS